MHEQQDDWVRLHLPGGPSVPVRKGSPVEAVFGDRQATASPPWRMQWSVGFLADFLWMALPECRPFLAERIRAEVEDAIDLDRELQPLGPLDIAGDVLWYPLIQPALDADPMDEERVARLLRAVREAFALEPPAWEDSRYGLRVGVLENLDVPQYISTVERIDPALFVMIRNEIGS
ncbi:hypothetical protein AB0G02_08210 [Actinosynnema sp. NPDC023658]|uniref:hypothetical protein n=1 Tax=Actinosynnema sp. NPDC023658 TaxID=3155465 RepID=UPI0033E4C7AE